MADQTAARITIRINRVVIGGYALALCRCNREWSLELLARGRWIPLVFRMHGKLGVFPRRPTPPTD